MEVYFQICYCNCNGMGIEVVEVEGRKEYFSYSENCHIRSASSTAFSFGQESVSQ